VSPETGLVLTGRLEEAAFADVMRSLLISRDTGLITCTSEQLTKTVHVQEGRIVFAQSSDRDDRLGEVLLREGMISVEQYELSGKLIRPGKRQGTILVELGYVTPQELVKGVRLQVEGIVLDLLRWRSGAYRIEMRDFETKDIITLNISTENLLFTGIKRGAGWSQVLRGLGGTLDSVLERSPDAESRLYKLDLSEDESHAWSLVNGRLSVAQICAMSYVSNFETCVTLQALTCCGLVHVGQPRDPETQMREQIVEMEREDVRSIVEGFNQAMSVALPVLQAQVGPHAGEILDAALDDVFDEHWDALRELRLSAGALDASVVVENVADVEPGNRRRVVERAMAALREAVLARGLESGVVDLDAVLPPAQTSLPGEDA